MVWNDKNQRKFDSDNYFFLNLFIFYRIEKNRTEKVRKQFEISKQGKI